MLINDNDNENGDDHDNGNDDIMILNDDYNEKW